MNRLRVLGVTRHGVTGSASRYRWLQYVPHLESEGIDCRTESLFGDEYVTRLYAGRGRDPLAVARGYVRLARALRNAEADVVFVEKDIFPRLPQVIEAAWRPPGVRYVVDLDDAVFHQSPRKFERLFRGAAAVTAGNAYLEKYAREHGASRVERLPTVVDLDKYPRVPRPVGDGPLVVGWIGAPVTSKYLRLVERPLARFAAKTGSRLRLVGAGDERLDGVPTERVPWTLAGEVDAMRPFDVGVMPLEDNPWERGKCALKLVQYMAMGIPVVASPVGANVDVVEDGKSGFLASTPEAWFDALMTLHDDPQLRGRMGRAGRARVEADFSLARTAPALARLLREVA